MRENKGSSLKQAIQTKSKHRLLADRQSNNESTILKRHSSNLAILPERNTLWLNFSAD